MSANLNFTVTFAAPVTLESVTVVLLGGVAVTPVHPATCQPSSGFAVKVTLLPRSTLLPELISLPSTVALSVPFPSATLKVTLYFGVGAGSAGLPPALFGQPVNISVIAISAVMMSTAALVCVKVNALFLLLVFILKISLYAYKNMMLHFYSFVHFYRAYTAKRTKVTNKRTLVTWKTALFFPRGKMPIL